MPGRPGAAPRPRRMPDEPGLPARQASASTCSSCSTRRPGTAMRSSGCCRTGSWACTRPRPGTIYPRLARLEEEGLVTHDEVDGRKVYRITDKGREELDARLDDLAELEEEITASVRDIAREVTEDVRDTVATCARNSPGRPGHEQDRGPPGKGARRPGQQDPPGGPGAGSAARAGRKTAAARQPTSGSRPRRPRMSPKTKRAPAQDGRGSRGWGDWPGWAGGRGLGGRLRLGWLVRRGRPSGRSYRDLERLAKQFARDLRSAAWHAQAVSEDKLADLRVILDETLDRIRAEVFAATAGQRGPRPPPTARLRTPAPPARSGRRPGRGSGQDRWRHPGRG